MAAASWPAALTGNYAARFQSMDPRSIEGLCLQMRDQSVRHLIAYLATGGGTTYEALAYAFLTSDAPHAQVLNVRWEWLASLARVVALQAFDNRDRTLGLAIYRHLHARDHIGTYGARHAKLFADLLLTVHADHEVQALLGTDAIGASDRRFLLADLHNPWRGGPHATTATRWLHDFEAAGDFCREPGLHLSGETDVAFDRLTATADEVVADALVSVVFPVYQPGESLWSAVGSMTAQSWSELEIIIVDDGSGDGHADLLEDIARSDPRIRLVHRNDNRGAYAARNLGLALARGHFVAFQDHDDWSHPRRIEHQVRPLLDDRSLVATHSRCARVSEELEFVHPGYHPLRHNASSLMIRRHEAVLGVGYFDEVRKSGDSEYHARLIAHFGHPAVENLRGHPVLAAVRRLDRSLSRSDFRAGWHHGDRVWYRDSYRRWHHRSPASQLFIDRNPPQRAFAAPRAFQPERTGVANDFDVLMLGDWHVDDAATRILTSWCEGQELQGRRVGIAQMNSLAHTTKPRPSLATHVIDLIHAGVADYVDPHEACRTQRLVIAHPSVLHFTSDVANSWKVEEDVVALTDVETSVATSPGGVFVADVVDRQAELGFSHPLRWMTLRELTTTEEFPP